MQHSMHNPNPNPSSQIEATNRNNNIYEDQGGGIKLTDGDGARGAGPENI